MTKEAPAVWLERLGPTCTRAEIAAFCGLSAATVSIWVAKGILPRPLPGTRRWSTQAVIEAVAQRRAAQQPGLSPYEEWARGRG
jgi:predicted DNA-binding transcriptional regulator AlpA